MCSTPVAGELGQSTSWRHHGPGEQQKSCPSWWKHSPPCTILLTWRYACTQTNSQLLDQAKWKNWSQFLCVTITVCFTSRHTSQVKFTESANQTLVPHLCMHVLLSLVCVHCHPCVYTCLSWLYSQTSVKTLVDTYKQACSWTELAPIQHSRSFTYHCTAEGSTKLLAIHGMSKRDKSVSHSSTNVSSHDDGYSLLDVHNWKQQHQHMLTTSAKPSMSLHYFMFIHVSLKPYKNCIIIFFFQKKKHEPS